MTGRSSGFIIFNHGQHRDSIQNVLSRWEEGWVYIFTGIMFLVSVSSSLLYFPCLVSSTLLYFPCLSFSPLFSSKALSIASIFTSFLHSLLDLGLGWVLSCPLKHSLPTLRIELLVPYHSKADPPAGRQLLFEPILHAELCIKICLSCFPHHQQKAAAGLAENETSRYV